MLKKKIWLAQFEKFFKCKSINESATFSNLFVKTPRNLNCFKLFFSIPKEINGLQKSFLTNLKFVEIKSNKKYMSETSGNKCWKCNASVEVKNYSCASCGALQYPQQNINYFELLGISQKYNIDLEELTQNFRNKQMIFHPDKFSNKSSKELEISEEYSSMLNKAYSTLKDPIARGFYLLEFLNFPTDAALLEQDFLLSMMEKNEELEQIDSINKLLKLMKINDELIKSHIKQVGIAFNAHLLNEAKINLLKLNYLMNLNNKMKEIHNKLIVSKYK